MKAQTQTIAEDKAANYQYDNICYLSGRRMVDEKRLSQELFKVDFFDLTYSQAEQMLEHLRALPQPKVGHTHTCFSCGSEFICICISNANSETGECSSCREGISLTAHLYKKNY